MLTPHEIDSLAEALAHKLAGRIPADDPWLNVHQAAQLLACSVPTVERLVRDGKIPSIKVGRLRRFRRADLLSMNKKGADNE